MKSYAPIVSSSNYFERNSASCFVDVSLLHIIFVFSYNLEISALLGDLRVLKASWSHFGDILERLRCVLERLGGILERLGGVLERLGAVLDPSWSVLERLGAVLERLGGVLKRLEAS